MRNSFGLVAEKRNYHLALLAFIFFACCTTQSMGKTGPLHDKVVVCYISTWAIYRPGNGAYSIENFDPNLCTHAVYAFAGLDITQSAIKSLDPWQDLKVDYGKGGYERLTALKRSHPHLKVNLAIGGWNEGSKNYSLLVEQPELRSRFVRQVSDFVRKYDFDGLDLDWEYPTQRGGEPADFTNFALLVKELREEFDKHNLLLTSAIGAAKNVIDQAYDIPQLSRYLHFLHIMCYDYHGAWDKMVGFNAPLHSTKSTDVLSVEFTIDYLLEKGAPANKIVLGLPFYGRTFQTALQPQPDIAAEGTGFQGPYTREDGFLGYNEICAILSNKTSGWTTRWDSATSQALAYSERDPINGLIRCVTFDNSRSIANKVRFAMTRKLAGLMIWSVDTDDFMGECSSDEDTYSDFKYLNSKTLPRRINGRYPLLRTINEAVPLALDDISLEAQDDERKRKEDEYIIIQKQEEDRKKQDKEEEDKKKNQDDDNMQEDRNRKPHKDKEEDSVEENEIAHGTIEDRKAFTGNGAISINAGILLVFSLAVLLVSALPGRV